MNNLFKISLILLVFTIAIFQQACDIEEDPYLVPVDTIPKGGNGPSEGIRKVLLEDYTGHKCPNCPEAAEEAHNLKLAYGDSLVLLTVHAGYFSSPASTGPFTYDFRTPEGTELNNYFGIQLYPTGMVNRKEYQGVIPLNLSKWQGAVEEVIRTDQQAEITFTNTFDGGTGKLDVTTASEFLEDLDGVYNIVVVVAESGIIKPQLSEGGVIDDYVHNHVLRASMNGTWGDPVGLDGSAIEGEINENTFTLTFDAEWVADNCEVIAYIYNTDTKEVIQADQAHLETE